MALKLTPNELKAKMQNRKTAESSHPRKPKKADKPAESQEIEVTTEEHIVNDLAIAALAKNHTLFHRANRLVVILPDDCTIRVLPPASLREKLCSQVRFVRKTRTAEGEEQVRPVHPPDWCVRAIDARGYWAGINKLEGVAEFPVLLPDGNILSQPGYHAESGIYLQWKGSIHVPARPSLRAAQDASQDLLEVIEDFPFADHSGRAAWLSALLSPIARFAYHGCTPLYLADANTRGSGKGLLINCLHAILTGKRAAALSYPDTNEERRKLVCSIALGGQRFVFLDNLRGRFGDVVIDSVLTNPVWKDRLMHSQSVVDIPMQAIWFATGNNVSVVADTARRICPMRLESPVEKPEARTDFAHSNLIEWVCEHRERLLAAACTILRAYCSAGRPEVDIAPWGSFESWSNLVRRAVVWIGLPDPRAACRTIAVQADTEAQDMAALFELWESLDPDRGGMTTMELMSDPSMHDNGLKDFQDLLRDLLQRYDTRALGSLLKKYRRRIIGGRYVDFHTTNGRRLWTVHLESSFSQQKFPEPTEATEPTQ